MDALLNAWYDLLNGQITYNSVPVKIYPGDPANDDYGHHVIIRAESETDASNGSSFMLNSVVGIEIVTVFPVSIDKSVVNDIDNQIRQLLFPTRQCALVTDGFQILNVRLLSSTYLDDDDGVRKYYRKETRFFHLLNEL